MAEDQLGIHILGPTYFGTRQVGLRIDKEIKTPADMAGIKLRMPGGDAWQFLGTALGANPTPMAYAEVYTGLQTGAIDGQDNPLPNVENMKFYEVMKQIVLTSHLVGYDLLVDLEGRLGRAVARADQDRAAGRRRQGDRLEPAEAPRARSRAARASSRPTASRSTSRTWLPSAPQRRSSTSSPTSPRTGRQACSTRSTRSSLLPGGAAPAAPPDFRPGRSATMPSLTRGSARGFTPARRTCSPPCWRPCSSSSSSRSSSATCSTCRSAGRTRSASSCGCGWCCSAPPSWCATARKSASTCSMPRSASAPAASWW